jgi:phosphoribosyl-ATP pyrophosphohydrolase
VKFLQTLNLYGSKSTSPEALMAEYVMSQNKRVFNQLYDHLADDLFHYLVSLSDHQLASYNAQKTW